jgi:hypothetical protein
MLRSEARGILLEDDHARLVSNPEEQPMPVVVAQPGLEAENVAVERLGLSKILDGDSQDKRPG